MYELINFSHDASGRVKTEFDAHISRLGYSPVYVPGGAPPIKNNSPISPDDVIIKNDRFIHKTYGNLYNYVIFSHTPRRRGYVLNYSPVLVSPPDTAMPDTAMLEQMSRTGRAVCDVRGGMGVSAAARKHGLTYSAVSQAVPPGLKNGRPAALSATKRAVAAVLGGMGVAAAAAGHGLTRAAVYNALPPRPPKKERLDAARSDVMDGGFTVTEAAIRHGVTYGALYSHLPALSRPAKIKLEDRQFDAVEEMIGGATVEEVAHRHDLTAKQVYEAYNRRASDGSGAASYRVKRAIEAGRLLYLAARDAGLYPHDVYTQYGKTRGALRAAVLAALDVCNTCTPKQLAASYGCDVARLVLELFDIGYPLDK